MQRGIFLSVVFASTSLPSGPVLADIMPIRTPSGNIYCTVGIGGGSAQSDIMCTIFDRRGEPAAPRPASCDDAWGHKFELLETGPVRMTCGGPGPRDNSPGIDVAGYGQTGKFGAITCTSSQSGFECRNGDGHGFRLSRQAQRIY